jgi:broad specificity phosphatase PhoE
LLEIYHNDVQRTMSTYYKKKKKNGNQIGGADGTNPMKVDDGHPTKTIYLIRHGQSQGQAARSNGISRTDMSLLDCGLTLRGQSEAMHIPKKFTREELESIKLVVSSPMTRALNTALLGFPETNIMVHYDLKELGSKIPENRPREMQEVLKDLQHLIDGRNDMATFLDVESLLPEGWPWRYTRPNVKGNDHLRRVFQWLYHEREESTMAIVCHYNVIRSAVSRNGSSLHPENALPIRCDLHSDGELAVVGQRTE